MCPHTRVRDVVSDAESLLLRKRHRVDSLQEEAGELAGEDASVDMQLEPSFQVYYVVYM